MNLNFLCCCLFFSEKLKTGKNQCITSPDGCISCCCFFLLLILIYMDFLREKAHEWACVCVCEGEICVSLVCVWVWHNKKVSHTILKTDQRLKWYKNKIEPRKREGGRGRNCFLSKKEAPCFRRKKGEAARAHTSTGYTGSILYLREIP